MVTRPLSRNHIIQANKIWIWLSRPSFKEDSTTSTLFPNLLTKIYLQATSLRWSHKVRVTRNSRLQLAISAAIGGSMFVRMHGPTWGSLTAKHRPSLRGLCTFAIQPRSWHRLSESHSKSILTFETGWRSRIGKTHWKSLLNSFSLNDCNQRRWPFLYHSKNLTCKRQPPALEKHTPNESSFKRSFLHTLSLKGARTFIIRLILPNQMKYLIAYPNQRLTKSKYEGKV